mmetsp:Transcript_55061/g.167311  ORF Transcript_55061/g.167311 Transcript_55061/m.167311 type:complete len:340 (-) Transcript_55061:4-1023(-)
MKLPVWAMNANSAPTGHLSRRRTPHSGGKSAAASGDAEHPAARQGTHSAAKRQKASSRTASTHPSKAATGTTGAVSCALPAACINSAAMSSHSPRPASPSFTRASTRSRNSSLRSWAQARKANAAAAPRISGVKGGPPSSVVRWPALSFARLPACPPPMRPSSGPAQAQRYPRPCSAAKRGWPSASCSAAHSGLACSGGSMAVNASTQLGFPLRNWRAKSTSSCQQTAATKPSSSRISTRRASGWATRPTATASNRSEKDKRSNTGTERTASTGTTPAEGKDPPPNGNPSSVAKIRRGSAACNSDAICALSSGVKGRRSTTRGIPRSLRAPTEPLGDRA